MNNIDINISSAWVRHLGIIIAFRNKKKKKKKVNEVNK